jgi:hypothetical protein
VLPTEVHAADADVLLEHVAILDLAGLWEPKE